MASEQASEVTPAVVVCDDEPAARRSVVRALSSAAAELGGGAYELLECGDGSECLALVERGDPQIDLVLLDLRMPGLDGMRTLERLRQLPHPPPVVVVTADSSLRSAIDAVKAGAADYLAKPYDIDELRLVVGRTLEATRLQQEHRWLSAEVKRLSSGRSLIGSSPPMLALAEAIERVGPSTASVVIAGESGTGKEIVARRLHELSPRSRRPFVTLNCAAIPDTLVESELFGHRRGAFTGADRDRRGKFQEAHRGTLFLDEIGDMAVSAQAKLLRVLQEGIVEPVGGGNPVRVDVRVVTATHRDLRARVAEGCFREDLLFRLRVVELLLPPLRERGADILLLARHFLAEASSDRLRLSSAAEERLAQYPWPGNVRELANAMERAAIFCRDQEVEPDDLPAEVRAGSAPKPEGAAPLEVGTGFQRAKARAMERFERATLAEALRQNEGNVSRAARQLGLHRQSLQQKLRKLGLRASDYARDPGSRE